MDGVPNLRGGIPAWLLWLLGTLVTLAIALGGPVATLIKDSGAVGRMDLLRDAIVKVQLDIAVMKSDQAGDAKARDLHDKLTDTKLDQILGQRKK
jgi:hypothetical protein